MKIYPVKGGEGLRDPLTKRRIPAEGLDVTPDPFWLQRLAHGDVSEKTPGEQAADAAARNLAEPRPLDPVDPATWKPEPGRNVDGTLSPPPGSLAPDHEGAPAVPVEQPEPVAGGQPSPAEHQPAA